MGKIKIVIGQQDEQYLVYLVKLLENGFGEFVDVRCFSKIDFFLKYLNNHESDVVLLDEGFGLDAAQLETCNCGYLCEDAGMKQLNGFKTIGKYQLPDEIYAGIVDIHTNGGKVLEASSHGDSELWMVQSFSGGTGASTVAAAAAIYSQSKGADTLYLNLEELGSAGDFFRCQEVQSQELPQIDPVNGVSFYMPPDHVYSMPGSEAGDRLEILKSVRDSGRYARIILDCGFGLDAAHLAMMESAHRIVMVTDGSEPANTKFYRGFQAILDLEKQGRISLTDKMLLLYNRFSSSKSSSRLENIDLPVVGSIPPVKHALVGEIIQFMLSRDTIFERMMTL